MIEIPTIDFSEFNSDCTARQNIVKQVYQACHEIGFIYLKNPGISQNLIERLFIESKHFFSLPDEVKHKLAWSDEFTNQGYVGIERERLDPAKPGDLKEAFNIGVTTKNNSELRIGSAKLFWKACTEVANTVLQAFALALQLPKDFFATKHDEQNHTLRLLHYPPLQQLAKPGQVRAGEHCDYGSITLLFQDEVGGLEVQTTDGEWLAAPFIPDTLIVNTGDLMQRWTNHVFCSTKHRVMIPSDDRIMRSRYSIAFFCHPNNDVEVACLPGCHLEQPVIYPPISARDYLISRLQATY